MKKIITIFEKFEEYKECNLKEEFKRDIITTDDDSPVHYARMYKYRWVGEQFQIMIDNEWKDADSEDFDLDEE